MNDDNETGVKLTQQEDHTFQFTLEHEDGPAPSIVYLVLDCNNVSESCVHYSGDLYS